MTNTNNEMQRFTRGNLVDFITEGVHEISSRKRRGSSSLVEPISEKYGVDVSEDTASLVSRLHSAVDASELIDAVKMAGLDEVEDYDALFPELDEDEDADLGTVMDTLDVRLSQSHADREQSAERAAKKKHRSTAYVPELVNSVGEDGTVYMAKTLSTTAKVKMAWDLHEDNEVVVVDNYEQWERLLGWEKLKKFPHGKNKIREELGDQLSDDVLDEVTGGKSDSSSSNSSTKSTSSGRSKRTKPTEERLNIATGRRHRNRFKRKAKDVYEGFDDDGAIGYNNQVKMLVLFPTTTELNMTDHWWIPGGDHPDGGSVAIANCNKGTYEYLSDLDEVWHVEDYIEQAGDYEFQTNHGPVTFDTIDESSLVVHILSSNSLERFTKRGVVENLPKVIPEYCDEKLYRSPEFPHEDDMLYAPISHEDVFWLRPILREQNNPSEGDAVVLHGGSAPRDIGHSDSLSGDYKLYARARLHEWDFDTTELEALDNCSYRLDLDRGGLEIIETLGMLHDMGKDPFSETPKARWTN